MAQRDSSPFYYRENAYLKRMPDDVSGGKLRLLALKKAPLKPMWTQLCVHNGRTPYLEQYRDPASARAHRPAWRASLVTARHVTASVTPRDTECDFLIDTHHGPHTAQQAARAQDSASLREQSPPETPHEIDISTWDDLSLPSTSQAPTSVAKICGQNICLDDSIFRRGGVGGEESGGEFDSDGGNRPSNITVIQVCNKEAPHTAIPVIGLETDIFDFQFKTTPTTQNPDFINIVNTETVHDYGTVFTDNESNYGHLSLTTTVSLTGDVRAKDNEDLYERLCMASTKPSPLPVRSTLISANSTPISANSTLISTNSTQIFTHSTPISANSTPISTHSTPISTHSTPISTHSTPISANSTPISVSSTTISSTSNVTEINCNRHVNSVSVSNVDSNARSVQSNIVRTPSQNAYDAPTRPERRLRGLGHGRTADSPGRNTDCHDRLRWLGHGRTADSPGRNTDCHDRYKAGQ
ncbi:Outer membrane protein [Operophtera brumata]|uniref:Outer membrane protein n=1 Tax=Operophtera brumata TaxID=104452 RepID=A0A0L7LD37_OPEBR|nr:Outer membrane protein [Operophtera brumata]